MAAGGNARAVGRLLTAVERGGAGAAEVAELTHSIGHGGHVIGITGPPGAGKSTLVGAFLEELSEQGRRPAVVAVDPSSPLSGGAILGDRIRMDDRVTSAFIRSMATRGHQGGLSMAIPGAVRVLDAAGFDPIIIETVGVGQVEVDVVSAADTVVVVLTPGMGDAVQANKAGLLELADVFVVNKADRPGATDTRRDLELMLDLTHISHDGQEGRRPEILMTTATTSTGVGGVSEAISAHRRYLIESGEIADRKFNRVQSEVRHRLEDQAISGIGRLLQSDSADALLREAAKGERSAVSVAQQLSDP